jgi:RNA polymerase sigma factor (sigma-70 family)
MSAFEKLVEQHRDNVYGLALLMTRSETCALDVAQTSFFSAYRHLNEFRTEADFDARVRRSAAELSMRQPAGVARGVEDEIDWREFNERGGPAMYCPTDWNFSADGEPLNAELRHAIQGATHQLPQDQREVFLLKDFADLTYEQIAEITGYSLRAIKHRLHQARLSLREAIDRFCSKGSDGLHLRAMP